MKASWKRLDLDVTKFCLEIILIAHPRKLSVTKATCEPWWTLCEDAVSFRTLTYEDICLLMFEMGLVWQNVLPILVNAKRLGAKRLFAKVSRFMWLHLGFKNIQDRLKFLLRNYPDLFLEVGMIIMNLND